MIQGTLPCQLHLGDPLGDIDSDPQFAFEEKHLAGSVGELGRTDHHHHQQQQHPGCYGHMDLEGSRQMLELEGAQSLLRYAQSPGLSTA